MSTETGMSFETVAVFPRSSLIKSKASLLETVCKEKFSLPKFFLSFYSSLRFQFPDESHRFKPLVIFVDNICEILVGNFFVVIERFIFFLLR